MATTKRKRTTRASATHAPPAAESCCIGGVCNPQRVQGLRAPARKGTHDLVSLKGPGLFLGASVSKQGGLTGLSFVSLEIDGRNVVNLSFAAASNLGLKQQNPFGIVLLGGTALQTLTLGFPVPLVFRRTLTLSVLVSETGVVQIVGNVVRGTC